MKMNAQQLVSEFNFGPSAAILSKLRKRTEVLASQLTTFGLGGSVAVLVEPSSIEELIELVQRLNALGIPWRILGAGSNLLISSSGVDEVVIRLGRGFSTWQFLYESSTDVQLISILNSQSNDQVPSVAKGGRIFVSGAASLMGLSRKISALKLENDMGLSGLEFAAGIPGSLGGAVVMNAGAHGNCMADIVERVVLLSAKGEIEVRSAEQMKFSYRKSQIGEGEIVLGAELKFTPKPYVDVSERRSTCLEYRRRTQPLHLPSAGSVFKNPEVVSGLPEGTAAAELLERMGYKGRRKGGVCFSEMHSNWLVRDSKNALAEDAYALIEDAKEALVREFEVVAHPEIVCWNLSAENT